MARQPNIVRPTALKLKLPEDKRLKLDLFLFSDSEGKVPHGAYQRFFLERINDFFQTKVLDLGPYLGTGPGSWTVRGDETTIRLLEKLLRNQHAQHPES